ncbi:transglutaminase-like domain-containing protein [Desertivirga xinjiangensis]|uniref:transglutaminase-like domain-containing protein n=1 Tax=Desertivirga xinjiangensis TaxID=539206 RepID=UPI00210A01A5|nr:transglutaminase domain-containing protein [Pedobacter xinjiangensis]
MPQSVDVSDVLHISTIPAWSEISGWYADVINNRTEENHYLKDVYATIFPVGGKQLTEFQKGKKIYDYIEKNIRYSSVSFRQSAYIPQKAALTLTTRLGDCKDLSNLFVTLAKMAGIKAQMVLVDTRDNGVKDLVLPGMDFNHCIVKANLDNKDYYLELTDSELPFASLPNNLMGALYWKFHPKMECLHRSLRF